MNLSIIIPLYNEENLIIKVITELNKVKFPDFIKSYELIIIDDCSTDNSYKNAFDFIQNKENYKILKHTENKGKGAAVKTGTSNAKGDVFLIQDADLELSPQDIPSMLEAMNKLNIQFVNGSRYLPGVIRPLFSQIRYLLCN